MKSDIDLDILKRFLIFHSLIVPGRGSHIARVYANHFPTITAAVNPHHLPWTVQRVSKLQDYVAKLKAEEFEPRMPISRRKSKPVRFNSKKQAIRFQSELFKYWSQAGVRFLQWKNNSQVWRRNLVKIFAQCPMAAEAAGYRYGRIGLQHLSNLARFMDANNPESLPIKLIETAKTSNQKLENSEQAIRSFYGSWEWRKLRMKVIKMRGTICECCGSSAGDTMVSGGKVRIVVDHIKPIRKHWNLRLDEANLQILCDECNMGKGSWDETDWRSEADCIMDDEPMTMIEQQLGERMRLHH